MRDSQSLFGDALRRGGRNTLVEHHHDVTPDGLLRLDAQLGAEKNGLSVQITLENGPLLAHRTRMRERKNLEPSGVGEHRPLPAHKTMDPAGPPENLCARAQEQMVGVGQEHLRPGVLEALSELGFNGGLGAHRHKERGLYLVMQGAKGRGPRPGMGGTSVEMKIQAGSSHGANAVSCAVPPLRATAIPGK